MRDTKSKSRARLAARLAKHGQFTLVILFDRRIALDHREPQS
jgi:hypothetical protein